MNDVEEVKARLDIAEVIGSYIQLKPAGRNLKALSPFKQEKTPSFMVSPEKGIWHDFSSNEGGDVISFVMKMEGLSFPEALEMLAKRAGVTLSRDRSRGPSADSRQKLYDAVEAAVSYYHVSLSKNKTALSYLKDKRGLSAAIIKTYKLGYAPDSWEGLTNFLLKKGFSLPQLRKAGLTAQKAGRSSGYDIFRGRIIFPIYDAQERAIGFSGRVLADSVDAAKYINTPDTPIYHKSTAIYGLKQAKPAIRQHNVVLVVEGNMDAVGLHEAGVKNAVAISGTALTERQLKSLSYLADEILLCFDSDEAGQTATKKAVELAASAGVNVKVITLPAGKDPDELVRRNRAAFQKATQASVPGLDWLLQIAQKRFDPRTGPGKKQLSDFVMPALQALTDAVEQDHYIKQVAQALDVTEAAVRDKLGRGRHARQSVATVTPAASQSTAAPEPDLKPAPETALENALLEIVVAYPDTRDSLADVILEQVSALNQPLVELLQKQPTAKLDTITNHLPQLENHVKILALRGEENYGSLTARDVALEAYTQAHHLRDFQLKKARAELARLLAEAERDGDRKQRDAILNRIQSTLNEDV